MDKSRMPITLTNHTKSELERMAEETGISQNQLVVMAVHSLLANYKAKGTFIFADLLNPDHKQ